MSAVCRDRRLAAGTAKGEIVDARGAPHRQVAAVAGEFQLFFLIRPESRLYGRGLSWRLSHLLLLQFRSTAGRHTQHGQQTDCRATPTPGHADGSHTCGGMTADRRLTAQRWQDGRARHRTTGGAAVRGLCAPLGFRRR